MKDRGSPAAEHVGEKCPGEGGKEGGSALLLMESCGSPGVNECGSPAAGLAGENSPNAQEADMHGRSPASLSGFCIGVASASPSEPSSDAEYLC